MAITENDLYCQIHDDHRSWSQPKATHEADWDEDGELLLVCLRHAREVRKTGHESCHQDEAAGYEMAEIETRKGFVTVCCAMARAYDEWKVKRA